MPRITYLLLALLRTMMPSFNEAAAECRGLRGRRWLMGHGRLQ